MSLQITNLKNLLKQWLHEKCFSPVQILLFIFKSLVIIVFSIFFKLVIWREVKESLVERNVLHVIIVLSNIFKSVIWRDIKESVLKRNVLLVIIVSSIFFKLVIWRVIKELILERNILHVIIVSGGFFKFVIWRHMYIHACKLNPLRTCVLVCPYGRVSLKRPASTETLFLLICWYRKPCFYFSVEGWHVSESLCHSLPRLTQYFCS